MRLGLFGVTVAYIVITDFKGALPSFLASSPSELAETMQPTSCTLTMGPGGVRAYGSACAKAKRAGKQADQ